MRPRPGPALLIVVAYVAMSVGGVALSAATGGDLLVDALFLGMLFVPYVSVGALIVWRRSGNAVGWLLAASGIGAVLSFFLDAYTVYGVVTAPGALPFVGVTTWVSSGYGWRCWPRSCSPCCSSRRGVPPLPAGGPSSGVRALAGGR